MSGTNEMHPGLSYIQKAIYDYVPERVQQWMNDRQTVQSVDATFREWDRERRIEQNMPPMTEEAKTPQSWNTDLVQSYMADMAEREYMESTRGAGDLPRQWEADDHADLRPRLEDLIDFGVAKEGNVASITEHPNYPTISQETRDAARATSVGLTNDDSSVLQFRQMERDRANDGGLEK